MKGRRSITHICEELNFKIHKPAFFNKYLRDEHLRYHKAFTAIDLIEDTQSAIEEYILLPDEIFPARSTLYIYGVLQAMYCQQDGVQHLYESVFSKSFVKFDGFIKHLNSYKNILEIRRVRNDIAGHPSSRNKKEFYFIAKGNNSKYAFEYGGYKPEFRGVSVNLRELVKNQRSFLKKLLSVIENEIDSMT